MTLELKITILIAFTLNYRLVVDKDNTLTPNTHRRRRRDATVELSRVGVGGVNTISQLAHDDCRRRRSHRRHDATRLAFGKFVRTRGDCRQLAANSVHTRTRLNSIVVSRRRCVLGFKSRFKAADNSNDVTNIMKVSGSPDLTLCCSTFTFTYTYHVQYSAQVAPPLSLIRRRERAEPQPLRSLL